MKVLDPGHDYTLANYDGEAFELDQRIVFMKRHGEGFPGNLGTNSGTNCQEVIRVLIDRVKYLDNQIHSDKNDIVLECLRAALTCFEIRAAERHGIDRTQVVLPACLPEEIQTCKVCGHWENITCMGHK